MFQESFTDVTPEIVPAPAGFADSPSSMTKRPASGARLYKKLEKRYRSEDKSRHYRHRQEVRAKVNICYVTNLIILMLN